MEDTNKVIENISYRTEKRVKAMRESGQLYEPKLDILIDGKVARTAGKVDVVIDKAKLTSSASNDSEAAKKGADAMMNLMNQGAKEFEERTGRPMTYADMRAMFG
jgi:hypothetical protein